MLTTAPCRQSGFTLPEFVIGSAVGVGLLSGAISLYAGLLHSTTTVLTTARLRSELQTVAGLMRQDLRRAGYRAFDPDHDSIIRNPFGTAGNDITIGKAGGEPAGSCITFSYDRDRDGYLGVGRSGTGGPLTDHNNVEQFGFRLHDGALESRLSGRRFGCNGGRWQDLTSPGIEITTLRFTVQTSPVGGVRPDSDCRVDKPCPLARRVDIALSGKSRGTETAYALATSVSVRNDRLVVPAD